MGLPNSVKSDSLRIIARHMPQGHWAAWFDGRSWMPCIGTTPLMAAQRLVAAQRGLSPHSLRMVEQSRNQAVFAISDDPVPVPQTLRSCPDCRGSGQYVGFTVIEDCRRCSGSGRIVF